MEELFKLNAHFQRVKLVTIITLLSLAIISLTALFFSHKSSKEFSKRIYIINKNEHFEAIAGNYQTNRPVEINYHVSRFHELFFTIVPDGIEIESNTTKAFYLCDESAKKLYNDLKERGFYNDMIQGNVVQKVKIDSVVVNTKEYPYQATCYALVTQTRATSESEKSLTTSCILEDVPRSLRSPNGLFMRDFRVIESKVIHEK
jgi:conjugative transposon TraK protein